MITHHNGATRGNYTTKKGNTNNGKIVEACINLRHNHKTKLPDAIITATPIFYDLVLISRNTSDIKNIEGLEDINAFELQ